MYLLQPTVAHSDVVTDFVQRCSSTEEECTRLFGSKVLSTKFRQEGYDAWVEQVKANAAAREWHSGDDVEPGHTLLLAEHVTGSDVVTEEYSKQFPLMENRDRLVGLVTLRRVLADADDKAVTEDWVESPEGAGVLEVALVPCYRDAVNFMLSITDIMTYIVCEGLPYKRLFCLVHDGEDRDARETALVNCNFDRGSKSLIPGVVRYSADLRIAHQLKNRIYEFRRKEG